MADAPLKPLKPLPTALITLRRSSPIPSTSSQRCRDLPPPPKRPRFASTPSSLPSLSRSTPTSTSSFTNEELDDARRQSALRVLNVWSQLEERYAKALDEDDIIDFEHDVIIKDKGVLKKNKRFGFGTLADSVRSVAGEEEEPSATDYEDDEDDADELDTFALVPESSVREGLLQFRNIPRRRLPPIGEADPADKDDLQSFLEANSRMQFDEDDDEGSIQDVLQALAERFSSSSEDEDAEDLEAGYTSFEEDLHAASGASLPPSSSPPSSPMITPGHPNFRDDDFSEDEIAQWEEEEVEYADSRTPQPARRLATPPPHISQALHTPEVIDLTSPSPSPNSSPFRRPAIQPIRSQSSPPRPSLSPIKTPSKPNSRAKSQTPATSRSKPPSRAKSKTPASHIRSPSTPSSIPQTPVRAKSKTPARKVREITPPPVASSSKVKLPAPPSSSPSLPFFSDEPTLSDNPFLDDLFPPSPPRSSSPLPPSSPIISSVDPSPVKPRPKPRARQSSSIPNPHSDSDSDDIFIPLRSRLNGKARDAGTPRANLVKSPESTPKVPSPKARRNMAEVVIPRHPSRAPSLPPPKHTESARPPTTQSLPEKSKLSSTPGSALDSNKSNHKGKEKEKNVDDVLADDSSPELRWKYAKGFTPFRSPSKEGSVDIGSPIPALMRRGFKRKRKLSFSSDSSDSDVPLATIALKRWGPPAKLKLLTAKAKTPVSSPKPRPKSPSPVKAKAKTRSPSKDPSSPPKTKKTKEKETAKVFEKPQVREKSPSKPVQPKTPVVVKRSRPSTPEKSPEIIPDSEPGSPSSPRRPSPKPRKSSLKTPLSSKSKPPFSRPRSPSPQTPPRRRSQSQGREQQREQQHQQQQLLFPQYHPMSSVPGIPPMSGYPVQDPQTQFHFAQAMHHLAYLMSGGAFSAGTPHLPYPMPWPSPFIPQQPPQRHKSQSRHASEEFSSPGAGPSRSRSDPTTTPTRASHPYPYTYDPRWSSGTLPPSSPPRSSSPPTSPAPLRPALRERSRSRGRRVSFKLGDDDRPHVRPGDDDDIALREEEEESEEDVMSTPDRLAILASPEIPVATPTRSARSGRRRSTESPSPSQSRMRGGLGDVISLEADDGRERGQTPGPPERSRSLTRR